MTEPTTTPEQSPERKQWSIRVAIIAAVLVLFAAIALVVLPKILSTPTIVSINPEDGTTDFNPQTPIEIAFDQAVTLESVASGVTFDPLVSFTVEKGDGNSITIEPEGGFRYDTHYQLTIGATVANALGRKLDQPVAIAFTTSPYVAVSDLTPKHKSTDVALNTPIVVEFDSPIVSPEQIEEAAQNPEYSLTLPNPLSLQAHTRIVSGTGHWLSPTRYAFYANGGLESATDYTVTVDANITADGHKHLRQPMNWTFATEAVFALKVRPKDGATNISPYTPVEVRLGPEVDIEEAGMLFLLIDMERNTAVRGSVKASNTMFLFEPDEPLKRGNQYQATIASGIRSTNGAILTNEDQTWEFRTMGVLEVDQVEPLPGVQDVMTSTHRISVRFNHPVVALTKIDDRSNLPDPLTITPPLPGDGYWLDTSTYVYSPTQPLAPSTAYRVQVSADLQDQTGGTLASAYAWQFTTIMPRVAKTTPTEGEEFADPTQPIHIYFNQPMQRASLSNAISIFHEGTGQWIAGNGRMEESNLFVFTPSAPLSRGAFYTILISPDARAAGGNVALQEEYRASFRVAPAPWIDETQPANGSFAVEPTSAIKLTFNTPMDWESVERNVRIEPYPGDVYTYTNETSLSLYATLQPETDYLVTIGPETQDKYGLAMGASAFLSFRTGSLAPSLSLVGAYKIGTYQAQTPIQVPIRSVNLSEVTYRLYRMDTDTTTELLTDYETWNDFQSPPTRLLRTKSMPLEGEPNKEQIERLQLGRLDAGIYYLEVEPMLPDGQFSEFDQERAEITFERQIMVVTPYAITTKRSADQLFVWVVDMETGDPVHNLPLVASFATYDDAGNDTIQQQRIGETDSDGVLVSSFVPDDPYTTIFLWSPESDQFVYATTNWDEGVNPWSFNIPVDFDASPYVASIFTDRPIYRPQQMVHIRGILREIDQERYVLPEAGQHISLNILDPKDNTVFSVATPLNEFGSFNTSVELDSTATPGDYRIQVMDNTQTASAPDIAYGVFTVSEYRKPAFEVTVTPNKSDLVLGEELAMTIEATRFSGGVVDDIPVRWWLMAEPYSFYPKSLPSFSFQDADDASAWYLGEFSTNNGELLAEGTDTTNDQGIVMLDFATEKLYRALSSGDDSVAKSYTFKLYVDVTDVDGQVISSEGQAYVHAGEFYIGVRPEGYVTEARNTQDVSLVTIDKESNPVTKQTLDVAIYQREWFSVREEGVDGQMYWTSSYSDTLVEEQTTTTNGQGRANISFTPAEGGTYRIVAQGSDSAGHVVQSSAFTWVYGGSLFWGINDSNRIDLIADKNEYEPGDTAHVLVTAPYKGMQALMTIERGTILEHRILTLQDTTELLEVPIDATYAPNVYVSVVLIKPLDTDDTQTADVRVGMVNLPVSTEQQQLTVSVIPDREQAGPREEVNYTIKTTDYSGKGVQAEVSLALVDRALLSLADDPNPSLTAAFYEERPVGIFTSQSLTSLVNRVNLKLESGAKGGGGSASSELLMRRDFPDTAYWNPSVVTGQDGTANVTVALPDNVTTWQMIARAVTQDTLVGEERNDIVASKPLMIQPSLPRFLTVGDRPMLQAIVRNATDSEQDTTVEIEASGLKIESPVQQVVRIPARDEVVVRWQSEVVAAGQSSVWFTASSGDTQDAVEHVIPVQQFVTPEVVASTGQVYDNPIIEQIALSHTSAEEFIGEGETGELHLEMVPSLTAGLEGGIDYLQYYPYGCTEQTVSRFLPLAIMYANRDSLNGDDEQLKAHLEQNLAAGLQRLYSLQQLDGGWGWWATDSSNPYLTAYVVQGLLAVQQAGYTGDGQVLERAITFLEEMLDDEATDSQRAWNPATRAYVLFVLAEAGRPDNGRTIALYEQRDNLPLYARAYLLMTLAYIDGMQERIDTMVSEMMGKAILHPTSAHWEEQEKDFWSMNTTARTTALVMQALVRTASDNFLIPNAVRYLMGLREQGHWQTTQETAITLMALTEYILASGEREVDYTYRAVIENYVLAEGSVDQDNLDTAVSVTAALADMFPQSTGDEQQASLAIEKQGNGTLYYTLHLHSYYEASTVTALNQGLGIERSYLAVDPSTLLPTGQSVFEVKTGDLVQVELRLDVPEDVYYLAVEDMLPAGLEALDSSLKTVSDLGPDTGLENTEEDYPDWWYMTETEIHDNRVALFATNLPAGSYRYTYLARAVIPGSFETLPARAYQMYAPEVFGRSNGTHFVVREP